MNFTNLERMINRSLQNQQRLHFSQLKNDYFTVIFQLLLIIVFLSSQYDEWQLMTRIFLSIAIFVALIGSVIMKSGFYGFLIYGENRHYNEIERDKIKSIVNNMTVAFSSRKVESRVNLLESLYPSRDADYDIAESDLDGEDEDDELEEEEEEDGEEEDENSDVDKDDDDEDMEDELVNDDDDDDDVDDIGKFDSSMASPPQLTPSGGVGASIKPLAWPNYPLLLKRSRNMLPSDLTSQEIKKLRSPLHIHQPGEPEISEFPVESDLFIGKAFVIVAGLQDSPNSYFKRNERKFEAVFQGRFKRAIPYSHVYSGQVYETPLTHIPARLLVNAALKVMSRLQPAVQIHLSGKQPYFLSPLASTAQKIIISLPGNEPSISYGIDSLEENMTLLHPSFAKMTSQKRKAFFVKRDNLLDFVFDPEFVYTFDFYQHRMNLATFKVNLGFVQYDIQKMLIGRPIQIMAVEWIQQNQTINQKKQIQNQNQSKGDISGGSSEKGLDRKDFEPEFQKEREEFKYLYNIEVWHKGCVSKNTKVENSMRDQVKQTPKKNRNFTRNVSQMPGFSPDIMTKKMIHEESDNVISPSLLLSAPFLDNRTRSKSQSSSFSSISTPPKSNSKDEINAHFVENTVIMGSPGKNPGSRSRPCSGGQKRSASIDMTLRGLNLFSSNNNRNTHNEGNITPPGQGQGQGQGNFVGTPDGPSPRIPLSATHKDTPKSSQKK